MYFVIVFSVTNIRMLDFISDGKVKYTRIVVE